MLRVVQEAKSPRIEPDALDKLSCDYFKIEDYNGGEPDEDEKATSPLKTKAKSLDAAALLDEKNEVPGEISAAVSPGTRDSSMLPFVFFGAHVRPSRPRKGVHLRPM